MDALEQNMFILKTDFAKRGVEITPLQGYFTEDAVHYEFTLSSPPDEVFLRTVKELEDRNELSLEKIGENTYRFSRPKRLAFLSLEECEPPILSARDVDPDGIQKAYLCLGRGKNGFVVTSLERAEHLLAAGMSGSGKSYLLHALIAELLCYSSADLTLLDTKNGSEFGIFRNLGSRITVAEDVQQGLKGLRDAVITMEKRFIEMRKTKTYKYEGKRLVVVIDELSDFMLIDRAQTEGLVLRLAQKGRAAGVHLIVATQDPFRDIVRGTIGQSFPTKVCLKTADDLLSLALIGVRDGAGLRGNGDAYVSLPFSEGLLRIQCPAVSDSFRRRMTF